MKKLRRDFRPFVLVKAKHFMWIDTVTGMRGWFDDIQRDLYA